MTFTPKCSPGNSTAYCQHKYLRATWTWGTSNKTENRAQINRQGEPGHAVGSSLDWVLLTLIPIASSLPRSFSDSPSQVSHAWDRQQQAISELWDRERETQPGDKWQCAAREVSSQKQAKPLEPIGSVLRRAGCNLSGSSGTREKCRKGWYQWVLHMWESY